MPQRIPVIAGNWKMYKSLGETMDFFEKLKPLVANSTHCEIVIAPPFPSLPMAVEAAPKFRGRCWRRRAART